MYGKKKTISELMKGRTGLKKVSMAKNNHGTSLANTLKVELEDGTIIYQLYDTDIITVKPNGNVVYNSGGFRTKLTKDRIFTLSPIKACIWQENHIWTLSIRTDENIPGKSYTFYDGIEIDKNGNLVSENKNIDIKQLNTTKRNISKFTKLITKDNLPKPNSGDCLVCRLQNADGTSVLNRNCIPLHIEEMYMHGSLIINALREAGYNDMQIGVAYSMKLINQIRKAVSRYVTKKVIKDII